MSRNVAGHTQVRRARVFGFAGARTTREQANLWKHAPAHAAACMEVFTCDVCNICVGTVRDTGDTRDACAVRRAMGCTPRASVSLRACGFVTCVACCCDWCYRCFTRHPGCDCTTRERAIRRVHECLFFTVPQ